MIAITALIPVNYELDEQTLIGRAADGTYAKFAAPDGNAAREPIAAPAIIAAYLAAGLRVPDNFPEVRALIAAL